MTRNQPRFGFPDRRGYEFRLHGQRYFVGASSIRTLKLLADIYQACVTADDGTWDRQNNNCPIGFGDTQRERGRESFSGNDEPHGRRFLRKRLPTPSAKRDTNSFAGTWPFRLRPQIRQVQAIDATPVLCLVVERTDDPTLRILAIWLRGRCGGSLGTSSLAAFATAADDRTRKEVARALKRMGAWAATARDGRARSRSPHPPDRHRPAGPAVSPASGRVHAARVPRVGSDRQTALGRRPGPGPDSRPSAQIKILHPRDLGTDSSPGHRAETVSLGLSCLRWVCASECVPKSTKTR
jgi:hypothetical protein